MIWSTPSSKKAQVVAKSAVDGGIAGEAAMMVCWGGWMVVVREREPRSRVPVAQAVNGVKTRLPGSTTPTRVT